ncbi:MAG: 50S ribosomal protein L9 [Roseburia sp.]|nr:50S ribosomal protein L9 [Roseburia sp.]MCM1279668.1 50S ribosomal protein L9 [Robinsoniella sp.]
MKIILLQDEKKLGKKGDIVNVNDGFARNYILPKKIGIEATNKNLNDLKLQKANADKIAAENLAAAQMLAKEMEEEKVIVHMKAGEGGRAFGSISSKEIATEYTKQYKKELDKKKLVLSEPIKSFGTFEVKVKLHPQVTAVLTVKVEEE